jgi:hypothetical protein
VPAADEDAASVGNAERHFRLSSSTMPCVSRCAISQGQTRASASRLPVTASC